MSLPIHAVRVAVDQTTTVDGDLAVPDAAAGMVVFAHGSGSGRQSPRNRLVADHLLAAELGILLVDLLTPAEAAEDETTGAYRFDIGLLACRLGGAVTWLAGEPATAPLPVGLFGASTGAAAALEEAAARPDRIAAVVSRGGRVDLAGGALGQVRAPTLLIVGGDDQSVLSLNRHAATALAAEHQIEVVPGAGHLFEEPGALDTVATLTTGWFTRHLSGGSAGRPR